MNRFGRSFPRVKGFFEGLRKEHSAPIGAAGFCWGGKHVCLLAAPENTIDGKPLLDVGFAGHPSMLTMPQDIENISLPIGFAIGDLDNLVSIDQCPQIKKIIENKPDNQIGEIKIYDGASHGFCVRVNKSDKYLEKNALEAEDQCISWFNNYP